MDTEDFLIYSENMVGVDYETLVYECQPIVQLVRMSEDFGLYNMEFKKGEW